MYLGLGLRLGSSTVAGFDADAAAYFDRASVTDATAKLQINDFVKGMKGLGLYSNMICWPLRSAQNRGSGTTAYSLGGLENPNASLVASPTWGTDGITTNGTSSYVISTLTNIPAFSYSVFNVCKYVSAVNGILGAVANASQSFGAAGMHNFFTFAGTQNNFYNSTPAQAALTLTNSIGTASMAVNLACYTSTGGLAYNGSQTLTNTFTKGGSAPNRVILGGRLGSGTPEVFAQSQHAANMIFSGDISASASAFYSLYKTTLGTGLGLP
jgi:hypothetical protein